MTPRHPASALAERWTTVDGVDVFYRESPTPPVDARVMAHVHGFGLSGRYLLPTAELLADDFHTYVPDLPGFGRSGKARDMLDIPDLAHAAADFFDDRGVERATLVGNSMGCPVILEFAHHYPERIDRAVLVSPAGGVYNQPLRRAMGQLAETAAASPADGHGRHARLRPIRRPEHRPDVPGADPVPDAAAPARDAYPDARRPGRPGPAPCPAPRASTRSPSQTDSHVLVCFIEGAAHAINFSHPASSPTSSSCS